MTLTQLTSAEVDPATLSPDARALQAHLQSEAFAFGVERGWWREVRWNFPHVDIAVAAATRAGAPNEFLFHIECTGYPHEPPLALQWDEKINGPALPSMRPKGSDRVGVVFRTDWDDGRHLYTPFDRRALKSHERWPSEYPRTAWKSTSTLANYITHLHALLNSRAYLGVVAA